MCRKRNAAPATPAGRWSSSPKSSSNGYARHWKPNPLESSAHALRKHILPALGHLAVDEIAVEHVRDWFASIVDRPGTANRLMPALQKHPALQDEADGAVPDGRRDGPAQRRADPRRVPHCPREVAVIRLLMLTGCRYGEVINLQ